MQAPSFERCFERYGLAGFGVQQRCKMRHYRSGPGPRLLGREHTRHARRQRPPKTGLLNKARALLSRQLRNERITLQRPPCARIKHHGLTDRQESGPWFKRDIEATLKEHPGGVRQKIYQLIQRKIPGFRCLQLRFKKRQCVLYRDRCRRHHLLGITEKPCRPVKIPFAEGL